MDPFATAAPGGSESGRRRRQFFKVRLSTPAKSAQFRMQSTAGRISCPELDGSSSNAIPL